MEAASRPTTPLYVRLPAEQAEKLDRAAFALKASKQDLVASLLERYVDPSSPAGLATLKEMTSGGGTRRVTIETADDTLTVGRHSFLPAEPPEVLTLEEVADLLKVDREVVAALAESGDLPGRQVGEEWRFARRAVLDWLEARER